MHHLRRELVPAGEEGFIDGKAQVVSTTPLSIYERVDDVDAQIAIGYLTTDLVQHIVRVNNLANVCPFIPKELVDRMGVFEGDSACDDIQKGVQGEGHGCIEGFPAAVSTLRRI